jgi:prepilin signal peptidase PulO-like enzyme (type II secretory pathway)
MYAPVLIASTIIFVYRRGDEVYPYKRKAMGALFLIWSLLIGVTYTLYEINTSRTDPYILLLFLAVAVAIDSAVVDLEYKEIPDVSNFSIAVLGIVASVVAGRDVLDFLLPAIAIFALFLLLACLGDSMGGGDVKIAAAIGFFIPLDLVLPFLLVTFGAGSAVGMYQIFIRKREKDYHIAFGPYIALSFTIFAFYNCLI